MSAEWLQGAWLVTGGCGFIGSEFIRQVLGRADLAGVTSSMWTRCRMRPVRSGWRRWKNRRATSSSRPTSPMPAR